jgi:hypothetical protein
MARNPAPEHRLQAREELGGAAKVVGLDLVRRRCEIRVGVVYVKQWGEIGRPNASISVN